MHLIVKTNLTFQYAVVHPYYVNYRALSVNKSHAAHVTADVLGKIQKRHESKKHFEQTC